MHQSLAARRQRSVKMDFITAQHGLFFMNRHLWLLAICQGLFLTNNITFIAINGLVGFSLAPLGWMATLPVMSYVVGGALSTGLVAKTQTRFGRKVSFQLGLLVALAATLLCAYAVVSKNFWLLCSATVIAGYYNANANLYRFAAAELAPADWREKAVSLVMAGGLLGAVLGPNLAQTTRNLMTVPFAGAYLALAGVALLSMAVLGLIHFPPPPPQQFTPLGRPLRAILRQPTFIIAAATGALGFGVMNLLMAATPLAMQQCGLPFSDAALVLEWHVIGMFAPGFFTGHLIKRFGVLAIMGVGVVLNALCIAVALSGVELHQFVIALFLLGVGWNFLFTGSTTLSLQTYTPEEKDRAQGALNFTVFTTLALSSFASGLLVTTSGWQWLNLGSLVPVVLTGAALVWLHVDQRRAPARQP
jgi:MFS family permease